jgi:FtsP/CotA-like multicopper oxidase with cupredoxin domain
MPKTSLLVKWGKRYRFRVINAASLDCPVQLQVEDHELTIIATDGVPVTPTAASHLLLFPGMYYVMLYYCRSYYSYYSLYCIYYKRVQ